MFILNKKSIYIYIYIYTVQVKMYINIQTCYASKVHVERTKNIYKYTHILPWSCSQLFVLFIYLIVLTEEHVCVSLRAFTITLMQPRSVSLRVLNYII